jgi:hypothetical protein
MKRNWLAPPNGLGGTHAALVLVTLYGKPE